VLFTGHSEHSIDSKGRLAIPAKYRNQLDAQRDGQAWYCVPWPGGVLRLYTERKFEDLAERLPQSLMPGDEEAEAESRFFGFAERLEMDGQGRIALPRQHLDMAGLTSADVVIVGARTRLEVRDRAAWQAGQQESFARLPSLVSRIEAKRQQPPT
jgi:MraZ protein